MAVNRFESGNRAFGLTVRNWRQQRLALAQVFLSAQKFVVLDEATSVLDEENEREIYERLVAADVTLVSISHRPNVAKFHTLTLLLDGEGGWKILTSDEYLAELDR